MNLEETIQLIRLKDQHEKAIKLLEQWVEDTKNYDVDSTIFKLWFKSKEFLDTIR